MHFCLLREPPLVSDKPLSSTDTVFASGAAPNKISWNEYQILGIDAIAQERCTQSDATYVNHKDDSNGVRLLCRLRVCVCGVLGEHEHRKWVNSAVLLDGLLGQIDKSCYYSIECVLLLWSPTKEPPCNWRKKVVVHEWQSVPPIQMYRIIWCTTNRFSWTEHIGDNESLPRIERLLWIIHRQLAFLPRCIRGSVKVVFVCSRLCNNSVLKTKLSDNIT